MPRAEEEVVEIYPRDEHVQFVGMMTRYLRKTLLVYNNFLKSKGKRDMPKMSSALCASLTLGVAEVGRDG